MQKNGVYEEFYILKGKQLWCHHTRSAGLNMPQIHGIQNNQAS